MNIFRQVGFYLAIFRYLRDPNQVDSVLNLGNKLLTKENQLLIQKKIMANFDLSQLVSEKFGLADFPMEYLSTLPPETLGGAYWHFLNLYNLQPHFYKNEAYTSHFPEQDYLAFRARQTHDLWHVVLGFSIAQEDEAGLMAFYFAQMRSQLSGLLVALSFVHFLMRRRQELPKLLDAVGRGWHLGKRTSPLILVRWENLWEMPLGEVRKQLGIASI